MEDADFLVIGGGIAGLSAAASLAPHGRTIMVEGEDALGRHSSGRSVAFSHYGIGNRAVRALTAWSRPFFETPPEGFSPSPIARLFPSLYFATEGDLERLAALEADMAAFTGAAHRVGEDEMKRLCPVLRTGAGAAIAGLLDPTGLKLDAEAMLQGYARAIRAGGGSVLTGRRVARIAAKGPGWRVETESGESFAAPVLVDAAGAWADGVAAMAGIAPIGIRPTRRTLVQLRIAPLAPASLPLTIDALGRFYFKPEAGGRLWLSPHDETACDPGDCAAGEIDVALAIDRLGKAVDWNVERVERRWAGLRSFAPDRLPVYGFAPRRSDFFWFAGQGGFGIQTAPAAAKIGAALLLGLAPDPMVASIDPEPYGAARFA